MTLPHGFNDPEHTNPRETCRKCNPQRKIIVDEDGDMDCFDKIFELKHQKCNISGCNDPCTKIVKGKEYDKFYCTKHFNLKVKNGEIKSEEFPSLRFGLAKLLVTLGLVKER